MWRRRTAAYDEFHIYILDLIDREIAAAFQKVDEKLRGAFPEFAAILTDRRQRGVIEFRNLDVVKSHYGNIIWNADPV